jgi:hypothetical protein
MSKKALLTEEVTRKMMKLANIGSLSDKFINEAYHMEEEEVEEGMGSYMEEEDEDPADDAPMDMGDEPMDMGPEGEEGDVVPDADDLGDMDDLDDAPADGKEEKMAQFLELLGDLTGMDLQVEMGDDEPGDEPAEEVMQEEEEALEEGEEALEEGEETLEEGDETLEETEVLDEEELVEQVMNRVAARLKNLSEDQKKEELVEALAKKIAEKLS